MKSGNLELFIQDAESRRTDENEKSDADSKKELTPEEKIALLTKLEIRFKMNENLHKGIEWNRIRAALDCDPAALLIVNGLEKAGHEPDVYNSTRSLFTIGTCSKEAPENHRNLNYDDIQKTTMALRVRPMTPEEYKILLSKGDFDLDSQSWLQTPHILTNFGTGLIGTRGLIYPSGVSNHNDLRSCRASFEVTWFH